MKSTEHKAIMGCLSILYFRSSIFNICSSSIIVGTVLFLSSCRTGSSEYLENLKAVEVRSQRIVIHDYAKNCRTMFDVPIDSPVAESISKLVSNAKLEQKLWNEYLSSHPEITAAGYNIDGPNTEFDIIVLDDHGIQLDILPMDHSGKLVNVHGDKKDVNRVQTWVARLALQHVITCPMGGSEAGSRRGGAKECLGSVPAS